MNKTKDMTVGSPTKTIFFFSVPVLLGTLFQQIYNMADTIIVGQFLGEDAGGYSDFERMTYRELPTN